MCRSGETLKNADAPSWFPVGQAFEINYIGFFGLMPRIKKGSQYIVCTDYLTKWAETKVVPTQTAIAVANFFVTQMILRHGTPAQLVSDQGGPFNTAVTEKISKISQSRHVNTTVYNPACNGPTEVFNRFWQPVRPFTRLRNKIIGMKVFPTSHHTCKQASTNFSHLSCCLVVNVDCRWKCNWGHFRQLVYQVLLITSKSLLCECRKQQIARENILKT